MGVGEGARMMPQADLKAVEALARRMATQGKEPAKSAFTAFALRQGWRGTPAWLEARAHFMASWRKARQPILEREARNEWRVA